MTTHENISYELKVTALILCNIFSFSIVLLTMDEWYNKTLSELSKFIPSLPVETRTFARANTRTPTRTRTRDAQK